MATTVSSGVWTTTDLGTAAFVMSRGGLELLGASRDDEDARGRRFTFRFSDPDGIGDKLKVDYANSPERAYDEAVRALKKVCWG